MNTNRMTNPPADPSQFGLVAWLEETRVALPLKGVECRFHVTGDVACVELDQIYHQDARRPLDCTYTFPLPAGAAVHRCEVHINGRVIRAKVEEKQAAKEIYRKQKAAGRRTALVETERENLFTLSLGNVQPGDVIVVCFAWFQVLDRTGDGLRLMVPTCPGVRYIPGKPLLRSLSGRGTVDDTDQVPDASRITPPRIDALHPDAAYFSIEGRLAASDAGGGTVSSPSHTVLVRERKGAIAVALANGGAVTDRDFVLEWREPEVLQLAPHAWSWNDGRHAYVLVQLRAPQDVKVAADLPQDFYFLVDRSGSMQGAKWCKSCEALNAFVGLLGPEDRVWITLFESEFRDFDEAPMPAPAVLADAGFQRMASLGTGGGTELLPALTHVLQKMAAHSANRRTSVILITDGQVGNEDAILHACKPAANVTVHTFGIDTAVNDAFLKSLARRHRGGCWLQTPDDDIAGTVAALGDRLRRPVLAGLAVEGPWETADANLPDIHAREVVTVALRGTTAHPVKITGRLPDGTAHSFPVELSTGGSEAVKLLWARRRIAMLLDSGDRHGAIAMAKEHNLICEGAAFIAWDEEEQVAIAKEELAQPALQQTVVFAKVDAARRLYGARPKESDVQSHPVKLRACVPFSRGVGGDDSPQSLREEAESRKQELERERMALIGRLRRELQDALRHGGVPESNIVHFLAWAELEVPTRFESLQEALALIGSVREKLGSLGPVEHVIRRAAAAPPEALVDWARDFRKTFENLRKLERGLRAMGMAGDRIERILAWVAESGEFDRQRLLKILNLLQSLKHGPFSAAFKERRWRELLEATIGVPIP